MRLSGSLISTSSASIDVAKPAIYNLAAGFLEAKRSPESLKTWRTWMNTVLGGTWEENAERIDDHGLVWSP